MTERVEFIKQGLQTFPEYKSAIFDCGYLVTNKSINIGNEFPYYGNWESCQLTSELSIYNHKRQKVYTLATDNAAYFLIGHAYNPFDFEWDENQILKHLDSVCKGNFDCAKEYIDDLTGLFLLGIVRDGKVTFCGDFEAMRASFYCCDKDGHWFIGSHEELVALHTDLTWDTYIDSLEKYRWYYLYGEGLPGDMTHYKELKKLIGNTYVVYNGKSFDIFRLWPRKPLTMTQNEDEYQNVVSSIADVMSKSMDLIARKWENPAVSTTGGRDSQGSLAAAVHLKDRYQFFSYNSQPAEKVDCDAAEIICNAAGVKHVTYDIALDKGLYPEYELVRAILTYNSNRKKFNHNDIMKRIFFRKNNDFDVEVKSWTSEIGRGYYYKKYGVRRLQKNCRARFVNIMNNIYLFNPILMYKQDAIYRDYLRRSKYVENMFNYDWTDLIELEMRDGQWGTAVISTEHLFAYDVTIPYNNRRLGDLFLSVPLQDRINDRTHKDFTKKLCPPMCDVNIVVRDAAHDKKREIIDKLYYFISSYRPL